MAKFVITNARIVDGGSVTEGDVLVHDDRIGRVDGRIPIPALAAVVDANGRYLVPGMIDTLVHFREPGFTSEGEIATESAAAVAGGITSFMDGPDTEPTTSTREALATKYRRAAEVARANFGCWFGATDDNLEAIKALEINEACGIEVNVGPEDPRVDASEAIERIFEHAPLLVAVRGGAGVTQLAGLASNHDTALHVSDVSTASALSSFESGPVHAKRITAGVYVSQLHFAAQERAALVEAIRDDVVDIIATGHSPRLLEGESAAPPARRDLPVVQDGLLALLEQVQRGALSIERVVQKVAHAPAERFAVRDRGYLREGYFADLVLLDLDRETVRTRDDVLYRCGWSPFEGERLRARIASTWVNGALAYDGRRVIDVRAGRRLEHGPQR